jgi:hypothetical protein
LRPGSAEVNVVEDVSACRIEDATGKDAGGAAEILVAVRIFFGGRFLTTQEDLVATSRHGGRGLDQARRQPPRVASRVGPPCRGGNRLPRIRPPGMLEREQTYQEEVQRSHAAEFRSRNLSTRDLNANYSGAGALWQGFFRQVGQIPPGPRGPEAAAHASTASQPGVGTQGGRGRVASRARAERDADRSGLSLSRH